MKIYLNGTCWEIKRSDVIVEPNCVAGRACHYLDQGGIWGLDLACHFYLQELESAWGQARHHPMLLRIQTSLDVVQTAVDSTGLSWDPSTNVSMKVHDQLAIDSTWMDDVHREDVQIHFRASIAVDVVSMINSTTYLNRGKDSSTMKWVEGRYLHSCSRMTQSNLCLIATGRIETSTPTLFSLDCTLANLVTKIYRQSLNLSLPSLREIRINTNSAVADVLLSKKKNDHHVGK